MYGARGRPSLVTGALNFFFQNFVISVVPLGRCTPFFEISDRKKGVGQLLGLTYTPGHAGLFCININYILIILLFCI